MRVQDKPLGITGKNSDSFFFQNSSAENVAEMLDFSSKPAQILHQIA